MYIVRTKNGEILKEHKEFPAKNKKESIKGFKDDIFIVIENQKLDCDYNYQRLKLEENYTEKLHPDYKDVKICYHNWIVEQLSNDTIIENLKNNMGIYLDSEYPIYKRDKHAGEGCLYLLSRIDNNTTPEQESRKEYIINMFAWITRVRLECKKRIEDLKNDDIIPPFEWEVKPLKK
ncbi:MAG: hypothetical protein MUP82_10390 [Candidatus Marinimicrobia bacterium]|nr:hypothetical protein [Candidatus Neomarinimicrobiota bacterium]